MDKTALFSLSYGVFFLSTKNGEKINACITNTAIQAASSPDRIAISCLNSNITCMMIKMSKVFSLSILDSTCTYELIERFGMHSARDTDKFAGLNLPTDKNGAPYLTEQACAVLTCRVVDSIDLGSHTLFIAEIDDAFKVSKNPPLTYADYHAKIKPKPSAPESGKKIVGWKCKICGYYYEGEKLPDDFICPLCGHPASDFEPVYDV